MKKKRITIIQIIHPLAQSIKTQKMIALAEEKNEECCRLREGLANAVKNPLDNKDAKKAPEQAIEKGQKAESSEFGS